MSGHPGFDQCMSAQVYMRRGSGRRPVLPVMSLAQVWRRRLLALLVATLPLTLAVTLGGKAANLAFSDWLMFASITFMLWHARDVPIRMPLVPVCYLNICSTVLSILVNHGDYFVSQSLTAAAVEVFKTSSLWAYFYLGVNLVRTRHDFLLFLKAWIAAATLVALSGVAGSLAYQHAAIQTPFSLMFRAQGTLGDSNLFAAHLILTIALTLLYCSLGDGVTLWPLAAILSDLAGILFAASRGGLMTFVAGCLFLLVFSKSFFTKISGVISVIFLLLLFVFLPNRDVVLSSNPLTARLTDTATSLSDVGAADRRELWIIATDRFVGSPLFGIGRGNSGGQVHNTYLEVLSETGLFGFATYVVLLVSVFSALIRSRAAGSRFLSCGIFVIGVAGMTISIENYRGIWILLGATLGYKDVYMSDLMGAVAFRAGLSVWRCT